MALPTLIGGSPAGTTRRPVRPLPEEAPLADPADLPPLDRSLPPWPGREVESGGVRLHVRETPGPAGTAPSVYVHGLSGSATNWTDLAAQLAPHAPGTALDLPGFGLSRPLASRQYSPDAHADAVLCFLAGQGRPVHLLGNSLGGTIAMTVAARRPELVRSLTLLAPAVPDRRPDPRRMSDPRMALLAVPWLRERAVRALSEVTPRRRVEQMIELCFGDPASVAEHRIVEAMAEAAERGGQEWAGEALMRTTEAMVRGWFARPGLWTTLSRVQAPTLVIWGGRDRLVSPRLAARTARTVRRGRLLELPEVGHVPQIEAPQLVARAVLGLWRGADTGEW
ncbi:MAG TPA: alpha/beta fold hydrolase [Pseudonocardia sp.]|jgi:pimeloyl-ACP methyl ester carboxylesterase